MSHRFPVTYLFVVQENRVRQFKSWYTAQARNRWNFTLSPDDMEAALYSNPLVEVGTEDPVTHYMTVIPVRSDQDTGIQLNPPNFADIEVVDVFGKIAPTPIDKLLELDLIPQPVEEP